MSDQQCREVFEKCAKDEGFILKKHDREYWYGNTGTAWRMWQASWNSRPSFVVPSEEELEEAWISAGDGDVYTGIKAIHSHLLSSGARESAAWEALERVNKINDDATETGAYDVALDDIEAIVKTALATRKEGA